MTNSKEDDSRQGVDEDGNTIRGDADNRTWRDYFPFGFEPYAPQQRLMPDAAETFNENGILCYEGPCGSGKTLSSLAPALAALDDDSNRYERILVLTSVKQQQRAFEEDLDTINAGLSAWKDEVKDVRDAVEDGGANTVSGVGGGDPTAAFDADPDDDVPDPVKAVTLVGKADLCCYTATDQIEEAAIHSDCEDLREPVRTVASGSEGEERRANLEELASAAKYDENFSGRDGYERVATDGGATSWASPYESEFPTVGSGSDESEYCPFYARYRAQAGDGGENQVLSFAPDHVMSPPRLMRKAAEAGVCPHASMRNLLDHADVAIANYMHVFDPLTVETMMGDFIGPETLLVVDEAHMLVPRARDALSDGVALETIDEAIDELDRDFIAEGSDEKVPPEVSRAKREKLNETGVTDEDINEYRALLSRVKEWILDRAENEFKQNLRDPADTFDVPGKQDERPAALDEEYLDPLRDPEKIEPDEFSTWASSKNLVAAMNSASAVGGALADAQRAASETDTGYSRNRTYVDSVGRLMTKWYQKSDSGEISQYLPMFKLEARWRRERTRSGDDDSEAWREWYRARLDLHNCIPTDEIADRLDAFGSVMIMSATLAPMGVYCREVGLNALEAKGRNVKRIASGSPFPIDNRRSFAVETPAYTYKNRRSTPNVDKGYLTNYDPSERETETRNAVTDSIAALARSTPGNVLIATPSYAEAKWAAEVTRQDPGVSKPVLCDESSSVEATERLKARFFAGGGKILFTGLRGTLTEGVDYDGDKLASAGVVGVPVASLAGPIPTAIRTAYDDRFGDRNGYDYAFGIPAVRKSRQAIGRVIRGADEVGVRALIDERYSTNAGWQGVREHFPDTVVDEFEPTEVDAFEGELDAFWSTHPEVDMPDAATVDEGFEESRSDGSKRSTPGNGTGTETEKGNSAGDGIANSSGDRDLTSFGSEEVDE